MKNLTKRAPILRETFEEMVSSWSKVLSYGESASVYIDSKDLLMWRIDQLQEDEVLMKKYFSKKPFLVVDLDSMVFEEPGDLDKIFQSKQNIFLLGVDSLLLQGRDDLLGYLSSQASLNKVSVLLFFSVNFLHQDYLPLFANGKNVFLQNQIIYPQYQREDLDQFVSHLEEKWQITLPEKEKKVLISRSLGRLDVLKQQVRLIRDGEKLKENILDHPGVYVRLHSLWEKFHPSEKKLLEKITLKDSHFTLDESKNITFLLKAGYVSESKFGLEITTPLFESYILQNLKQRNSIKVVDGEILLNGVNVDPHFSAQERRVLQELLPKSEELVSRDQIAECVWGSEWEEKYSDWAIDKVISRIRKKIVPLGIASKSLKTIKKKGFVWR